MLSLYDTYAIDMRRKHSRSMSGGIGEDAVKNVPATNEMLVGVLTVGACASKRCDSSVGIFFQWSSVSAGIFDGQLSPKTKNFTARENHLA